MVIVCRRCRAVYDDFDRSVECPHDRDLWPWDRWLSRRRKRKIASRVPSTSEGEGT